MQFLLSKIATVLSSHFLRGHFLFFARWETGEFLKFGSALAKSRACERVLMSFHCLLGSIASKQTSSQTEHRPGSVWKQRLAPFRRHNPIFPKFRKFELRIENKLSLSIFRYANSSSREGCHSCQSTDSMNINLRERINKFRFFWRDPSLHPSPNQSAIKWHPIWSQIWCKQLRVKSANQETARPWQYAYINCLFSGSWDFLRSIPSS